MTSWMAYTELTRRIDAARIAEADRAGAEQRGAASAFAVLAALEARIADRGTQVDAVARRLRLTTPVPGEPAPARAVDLSAALRRAADEESRAGRELGRATDRALLPRVLPLARPAVRNAAVYGVWAALDLLAQWALLTYGADPVTAAAWALFGFPSIAWFGGFLTSVPAGSSRLRSAGEPPVPRAARLGALICFAALPAAYGIVKLLLMILTH